KQVGESSPRCNRGLGRLFLSACAAGGRECLRKFTAIEGIPVTARDLDGVRFSLSPASPAGMRRHSIPPVAPGATLWHLLRRLKPDFQLVPKKSITEKFTEGINLILLNQSEFKSKLHGQTLIYIYMIPEDLHIWHFSCLEEQSNKNQEERQHRWEQQPTRFMPRA
ncbi:MAG TPA: hypothetical protein PL157_22425, partial [Acidobacteriota bacterium]|nr:hypothetical protein [Acidobacteriota bacterium]